MNEQERQQIASWVEHQLDETLSADEFDQLQECLVHQPEARELYVELMNLHAHLREERFHLSAPLTAETKGPMERLPKPRTSKNWPWKRMGSAVLVVAGGLLVLIGVSRWAGPANDSMPIAELVDASDAQWGDCSLPTAVGSSLTQGRLELKRGLATVRFVSGAEVTLEAPAILVTQTRLAGQLLSGTAIIEVPDSAHGFTLTTPTAVAIDHGTAFAVTVDQSDRSSTIEVIDGEVEVQHLGSDASLRLKEKQFAIVSDDRLSESMNSVAEAQLMGARLPREQHTSSKLLRITTADGRGTDASVSQGEGAEVQQNQRPGLILVKHAYPGYERFSRKGYFCFDLSSLPIQDVRRAQLVLTLARSGLGFASRVDDCEFVVYGLVDESQDDWPRARIRWSTAPGNRPGSSAVDPKTAQEVGRFRVPRGVQHGQVSIEGSALVDFLNADNNQLVTLIVVRETCETKPGGLVHGFVSRDDPMGTPPTLLIAQ